MTPNNDYLVAETSSTGEVQKSKHRDAIRLLRELTAFGEAMADEITNDAEFDVEFTHNVHLTRLCLMRWIALQAEQAPHYAYEFVDMEMGGLPDE